LEGTNRDAPTKSTTRYAKRFFIVTFLQDVSGCELVGCRADKIEGSDVTVAGWR
jgi:hypothetical protein